MQSWIVGALVGVGAGLVAAAGMDLYQRATEHLFGQDQSDDDPATVKAADTVEEVTAGKPVPQHRRKAAGSMVHYATGAGAGALYGALAPLVPATTVGFGTAYGVALMLVLDDTLVPAFGWGSPPWKTGLATHAYSLTSHLVFGALLEGGRRAGEALVG